MKREQGHGGAKLRLLGTSAKCCFKYLLRNNGHRDRHCHSNVHVSPRGSPDSPDIESWAPLEETVED